MTTFIGITCAILLSLAAWDVIRRRKENERLRSLITYTLSTNEEMRKTMAMGLYYRFRKLEPDGKSVSKLFIREDPYQFEKFCAEVIENYYEGSAYVSKFTGEFGVDIEQEREDGLYLGQVKCYERDVTYEPIAILHSQMIKHNAKGGFIITSSDYSEKAKEYAAPLNIELINGSQLVEYWIRGLEEKHSELKEMKSLPDYV